MAWKKYPEISIENLQLAIANVVMIYCTTIPKLKTNQGYHAKSYCLAKKFGAYILQKTARWVSLFENILQELLCCKSVLPHCSDQVAFTGVSEACNNWTCISSFTE